MTRTLKNLLVYFVVSSLMFVGFTQSVQAALISTEQVATVASAQQDRARISAQLARPEVQAQLESLGISKSDAEARVAALTDDEASLLARNVDTLPAGGDGIVGAILLVFLILLVTDILGFTKVFPFTRTMR